MSADSPKDPEMITDPFHQFCVCYKFTFNNMNCMNWCDLIFCNACKNI